MPVLFESPDDIKKSKKQSEQDAPELSSLSAKAKTEDFHVPKPDLDPDSIHEAPPKQSVMDIIKDKQDTTIAEAKPMIRSREIDRLKNGSQSLGSLQTKPRGIFFATQERNEQILLFLRKHPITQVPWVVSAFILIFIPILFIPLSSIIAPFDLPEFFGLIFTLFWYLIVYAFIVVNFIFWYYNANIVTNKRIVDIDFIHLLQQEVSATRVTQIEDVTYKRIGLIASFFDYGSVYVQTAGAQPMIEFISIPQPKRVTSIIIELMGQET